MLRILALATIFLSAQAFAIGVGSGGSFQGNHGASVFRIGDPGTPLLGLRNDGGSTVTGSDLTYGPLSIDNQGRLNVNSTPGAGGASSANQLLEINDLGLIVTTTGATATTTSTVGASLVTLVAHSPTLGQKTGAGSIPVVFPSDIAVLATSQSGRAVAFSNRIPYATSTVTTSNFTLVAGNAAFTTGVCDIFDSSGQTLLLATDSGSTVGAQIRIVPGGNGVIPLKIVAGSPVSIKAISANATAGEFDINCYQ